MPTERATFIDWSTGSDSSGVQYFCSGEFVVYVHEIPPDAPQDWPMGVWNRNLPVAAKNGRKRIWHCPDVRPHETDAWQRWVWPFATGILFIGGRLSFCLPDGTSTKATSGAPSALIAYSDFDREVLRCAGISGYYLVRRGERT